MDPNGRSPIRAGRPSRGGTSTDGPADGDFARLLEQASSPAAHRLGAVADPYRGRVLRDSTRADVLRETNARGGAARARARGAAAGALAPAAAPDGEDAYAAPGDVRAPSSAWTRASGPEPGSPVPAGRWGARGAADGAGVRTGPVDGPPDLVGALDRWRRTSARDRFVQALFALAVLGIVVTVVEAALESPGDGLGALMVIAAAAFILFRGLFRRRPNRPPRP